MSRNKSHIPTGGENISSVSLESLLATHPSILEVGVVAIPDEQWGERPKAYITTKSSAERAGRSEREDEVKASDIIAWAKNHDSISGFMVPKEVEIVEELPKTSTGKVKKNVLREWAKGRQR